MGYLAGDLLADRNVLITGGGTGLGLAMGRRFLELGASIVICGRRQNVLDSAIDALKEAHPGKVTAHVCDIRSAEAVETMMDAIFAQHPIDILVNNAAATFIAQTHLLSARAADAILGVTLHGALYCTLAAGRRWIEAKRPGVVLSILSTSTITGRAFTVPSSIAKSGVLAMTRSLAVEWGPRDIRLVAIAPGSFPTPGATAQLNPESRRSARTDPMPRVPLGRAGEQGELADMAAFLVSDAARYMTGEMVVLDGGGHLRTSGVEDLTTWSDEQWSQHRERLLHKP
ncbi:MAG: short-chain dehydrogenase/reductase [Bradyrhizobium sp.]|nr:short-chain dehydrogenase/reductase [Bradyrhizobium sp.]